jgi:N-acyl-D-amino-acid deacylase
MAAKRFDLVIRGGNVMDGTGNPWLTEDIAIVDGVIKKVGSVEESSEKVIDAKGMLVSPGFIDLHNHDDLTILALPNAESHIMQGITTSVVGNCGIGLAPLTTGNMELVKNFTAPFRVPGFDYEWDWKTMREYYDKVEKKGITINLAPLVPHGIIRFAVKGSDSSEPSQEEMNEMKQLLRQGLEDGAFGLSSCLIFAPGSYSKTEELIELASVLKKYGAIYSTHIRNEGDRLIESVEEAIRVGEANNIPVEIAHHKASGKTNWGKVNGSLRLMEQARKRGVEISCDVYPYTAASLWLTSILPVWVTQGGREMMVARLRDSEMRLRARKEIDENTMKGENWLRGAGWDGIFIAGCPSRREYEGKSLIEIFKGKGQSDDLYDGLFDLCIEIEGPSTIVMFAMDEDDVRTVMSNPLSTIISDSWVSAPITGGKPHPRAYGTFPRFLGKYVRDEGIMTMEEGIRKITSLPAGKVRLKDRGIIKEGFRADIVVFDPDKIKEKATFNEPHQYPEGIDYVIVNGEVVVEHGELTGVRPGKVLRK